MKYYCELTADEAESTIFYTTEDGRIKPIQNQNVKAADFSLEEESVMKVDMEDAAYHLENVEFLLKGIKKRLGMEESA